MGLGGLRVTPRPLACTSPYKPYPPSLPSLPLPSLFFSVSPHSSGGGWAEVATLQVLTTLGVSTSALRHLKVTLNFYFVVNCLLLPSLSPAHCWVGEPLACVCGVSTTGPGGLASLSASTAVAASLSTRDGLYLTQLFQTQTLRHILNML